MNRLVALIFFAVTLPSCGDNRETPADAPTAVGPRVLFVGNSYTFVNDVPGLMRSMVSPLFINTRSEEVLPGGYRLAQHAADARADGTPLARWLRTGTDDETAFSAVVLQEQSQIGGFNSSESQRIASVAGFEELATLARAHNVPVVLYQTWGRRLGDSETDGYETFESMEARLESGYLSVAAYLRKQGLDVRMAPVGVGFRLVYEDAGANPTADDSEFTQLYDADGSHPSLQGAYLAACIIAGTITHGDVVRFADEARLGSKISTRLRNVCARALIDERGTIPPADSPTPVLSDETIEFDASAATGVGTELAMSGDATRMILGATQAALFIARGQQGWSINQTVAANRQSVAMANDGNYAIAGTPPVIWHRNGDGWTAQSTLLFNSYGFALSYDGARAGALGGGMTIFARQGNSWSVEAELPVAASLAFDASAAQCVITNYGDLPIRAMQRVGDVWQPQSVEFTAGSIVSMAGDGQRFVAAAPNAARLNFFARVGNTWRKTQQVQAAFGRRGEALASNADGTVVVAGSAFDTNETFTTAMGSATVYRWRDGRYHADFILAPAVGNQLGTSDFGASVAVSSDGKRVAVGAPRLRNGAVFLFTLPQ